MPAEANRQNAGAELSISFNESNLWVLTCCKSLAYIVRCIRALLAFSFLRGMLDSRGSQSRPALGGAESPTRPRERRGCERLARYEHPSKREKDTLRIGFGTLRFEHTLFGLVETRWLFNFIYSNLNKVVVVKMGS